MITQPLIPLVAVGLLLILATLLIAKPLYQSPRRPHAEDTAAESVTCISVIA